MGTKGKGIFYPKRRSKHLKPYIVLCKCKLVSELPICLKRTFHLAIIITYVFWGEPRLITAYISGMIV